MHPTVTIRPIQENDNTDLAIIIRNALAEFGANKPGTVFFDPTTDELYELFQTAGSFYFVAEDEDGQLLGGGGIFPTAGLPDGTCELVKMYLTKNARGKGLGKLMIEHCLAWAKENGYTQVYLETMPELKQALKVYELFGFEYLDGPLGNSGHFGCDRWMLKKMNDE
ncbi:MAG: GNAT family N-acetyltransferase [Chitinophagaceae bacterium]|jgi:putative acetyltransferase|nr:GNAT family N-acetyltransferase [Chitinophagaceae bacterium]